MCSNESCETLKLQAPLHSNYLKVRLEWTALHYFFTDLNFWGITD